jgi:Pyrroline-5-carboxylate reductase
MDANKKIGFIGGGNMAYAIAKALVSSGVVKAENVMASARTRKNLDAIWKV